MLNMIYAVCSYLNICDCSKSSMQNLSYILIQLGWLILAGNRIVFISYVSGRTHCVVSFSGIYCVILQSLKQHNSIYLQLMQIIDSEITKLWLLSQNCSISVASS